MPRQKHPSNEEPGMVALSGSERKPNTKAKEVGATSPETVLDVTVRVRPREELPAIPERGEVPRMTHQQWEAKHGADPSDIKKVEEYATACGLKVETTSVEETRQYIRDFGRLAETTFTARELYDEVLKLYPNRFNPGALWASVRGVKP